jgi:Trichohyalin-plectin-homology domain
LARERAEEEEYRVKMMEKFAEDDRVEQMNAQRRRLKVAAHHRDVERLLSEKRRMFEEQRVRMARTSH